MEPDILDVSAYVDAAAAGAGLQLDAERRAAVVTAMRRLAALAAELEAQPLARDVELAGRFIP